MPYVLSNSVCFSHCWDIIYNIIAHTIHYSLFLKSKGQILYSSMLVFLSEPAQMVDIWVPILNCLAKGWVP